jgi:putative FmdB family regulatory protein
MPIYEYYCPTCDGRFSHLARRYDEAPPVCPGCGSHDVEKMVSRVNLGRSDGERQADFDARSQEIDQGDSREIAKFLQESGSLADEQAPIEREAFREIVARRAEGATDDDLQDVVDALPFPRQTFRHAHDQSHEHAHAQHHSHGGECDCGEDHGHAPSKKSGSRRARDLGWA